MPCTLVHRIYNFTLVVTLCAIFVVAELILDQVHFKIVSQAAEMAGASGSYGELPPVW
jgi:hypothetical protein